MPLSPPRLHKRSARLYGANPRYDLLADVVALLGDESAAESEIKGKREFVR